MVIPSKRWVLMLALSMLLFGCGPNPEGIVVVMDCNVKALDKKTLDVVLLTARNNAWNRFRLDEFAAKDDAERMLCISPMSENTEDVDVSLTIVIRDGAVVQEHWGR